MATTTPNFGWSVPTSTDLVKDGATAIETLGDAIDASLLDLKGGTTGQVLSKNSNTDMDFTWVAQDDSNAIQNAIVDAKGDVITATAADTPARLAVGANDTVLTADSTTATGLKWAAVSGGGRTLINTGGTSMNGVSTITISSIPSTYQSLYIVIDDFNGAGSGDLLMRPNNNTGGNYVYDNRYWSASGSGSASLQITETSYLLAVNVSATNSVSAASISIDNYASTTAAKPISARGVNLNQTTSGNAGFTTNGGWFNATAISSLTFLNSAGFNWSTGTIYVYGVK
jgi:hypothetical protein